MREYGDVLKRCETLLDAVMRFIDENPVTDYDEADCDGSCLRDDCEIALHDVKVALSKLSEEVV